MLGNTLAVCRKSYVHPGVVSAFLGGTLKPRRSRLPAAGLRAHERRTLAVLLALEKATAKADHARKRMSPRRRVMRGREVPAAWLAT